MTKLKLNTLLAVTTSQQDEFKAMVKDYGKFFVSRQGAFLGERGTYEPKPDTVDDASRRKNVTVQTTVDEKFAWFTDHSKEYLDNLFTVEKTNANNVLAELIVDGESWGNFTSLELLRLKGLLEDSSFMSLLSSIPVRSDSDLWSDTTAEQYSGRKGIMESPLQEGEVKTTEKESYILEDPNIGKLKDTSAYSPQLGVKNTTRILGTYTTQRFSGEWSQRQKAELLAKRNGLYNAVIKALKVANEAEVVDNSKLGSKVLEYLF